MAKIIDTDMPIKMGNCIHVQNCDKACHDDFETYICIQVEEETGDEEYAILVTDEELSKTKRYVAKDTVNMIPGRIYTKFILGENFYCVKLNDKKGGTFVAAFPIRDWVVYFKRAISHPNTCTKKSLMTDLLD